MTLTIFSWLLALSAIMIFSLALFALRRRAVAGALPFAIALSGEFIWCAGYWLELRAPSLGGKLFWDNVQFIGTDIGVAGAFLFACVYTGHEAWVRRYGALLAILPAITFLLIWSNPAHELVRSAPQIVLVATQGFLVYTYGPWFWVFVGYNYLLTMATLGLLIAFAAQSRSYRQPVMAFVLGFSAPAVGSLLTVSGLVPIAGLERLDISALTFAITIPLMTWALFRKRLLDIVPIARTLLVEQMRDAVLVIDTLERVVDTNLQAAQLLRRSVETIVGTPISTLVPSLSQHMASIGESGLTELTIDRQPPVEVEAAVTALRGRRGKRLGWLVVLRDITAQKRQSRYHHTLAICSQTLLRSGYHMVETDHVLSDVLGLLGKAAEVGRIDLRQSTPTADGELQTLTAFEEDSPEVAPFPLVDSLPSSLLPELRESLEGGQAVCGPVTQLFAARPELARDLAAGGVRSLLLIPIAGAQGWWGILRASSEHPDQRWDAPTIEFLRAAGDMIMVSTSQWEARRALLQAKDEAEAANRAKNVFLSMMSHELRTPLTAVLGYSQLLEQMVKAGDYSSVTTDLNHIYTAGQHLLALINDVLDVSRIEAGKLQIEVSPADIPEIVRGVAVTVGPLVERNRNTLQINCPATMAPMVSDATRVRQILLNLLNNAAKFTEAGTITLTVEQEEADGAPWISFQVADTGIGIDASQRHKLFKPFSQVDGSQNRKYGGTGLGLVLSLRLCQMLGGDITMNSRPGEGSVFTARLPMDISGRIPGARAL